ncbi:BlaI/MecI/CopY family transcriptional regulator [Anaerolentibacter hominis]|uniref:BlaI/MecI/CopY family transcriptional regulator n=1 Tax=Anaerolentibacter hominis TaxID=3079009 RepID=UPI0031B7EB46
MKLSDTEWEVMKVLWSDKKKSFTQGEVVSGIRKRGINWASNTIHTLLARLEKKKAVRVDKRSVPFHYSAQVSREHCCAEAVSHFLDKAFSGSASDLLNSLINVGRVSKDELIKLAKRFQQNEDYNKEKGK